MYACTVFDDVGQSIISNNVEDLVAYIGAEFFLKAKSRLLYCCDLGSDLNG